MLPRPATAADAHRRHCRRSCCLQVPCSMSSAPAALRPLAQQLISLNSFLSACGSVLLGGRSFAAAGRGSGGASGGSGSSPDAPDDELPAVNPKYRQVQATACCGQALCPARAAFPRSEAAVRSAG